MKQFLDYIPLLCFLVVYMIDERIVSVFGYQYTLGGIFSATEILFATSILVYGTFFIINRKLSNTQLITLVAVIVFCSFTIIFRSEAILKWKAPVVNWIFSAIFLVSHFLKGKPAIQRMLDHALTLPDDVWMKLNLAWAGCFLFLGCINLFVAFTFHEIWVQFKVFGSLGILLAFNIAQAFYIAKYIDEDDDGTIEASDKAKIDTDKNSSQPT